MSHRSVAATVTTIAILCAGGVALAAPPANTTQSRQDADGFLVHSIHSQYQAGDTAIRVLLPDRLEADRRYPVLYVLPVEAGDGPRWGDGLAEVKKHHLANRFGLICVAPNFSDLPWYANHPTDPKIRQESYILKDVVPLVDKLYSTRAERDGRLLLGFSKSGWGAFCLLLRHPDTFGKAVAWDAPLMMDRPGRYGSGPIFGTEENFAKYEIASLLRSKAPQLQQTNRLINFGYGNFREHHEAAHRLMDNLGIRHTYRDGPQREHSWHSGWLPAAVEMLMADERLDSSARGGEN
jgi:S-formylglutathione hydrolase FrmB